MDEVRKLICMLFGWSFAFFCGILVMIKGWGLEPKSWGWIIGGSIFGHIIAMLIIELAKAK